MKARITRKVVREARRATTPSRHRPCQARTWATLVGKEKEERKEDMVKAGAKAKETEKEERKSRGARKERERALREVPVEKEAGKAQLSIRDQAQALTTHVSLVVSIVPRV